MIWQIDPRKRSRSSLIAIEVFGASNCFFAVSCHFEWSQSGWDKVCLKFCVWYGSFSSRYGLRQEDMILKTFIVGPGVKLRRHNFQGRGIWCLFVKNSMLLGHSGILRHRYSNIFIILEEGIRILFLKLCWAHLCFY